MEESKNAVATPELEVVNNEEEEMSLVVSNSIDTGLLTGSSSTRMKKYTNLNPENEDDADILLSLNEVDSYLKDEVGKELVVIGHVVSEYPRTREDEDTGELIEYLDHSLILITEDGKSHVTGSSNCYRDYETIIGLKKRTPSREEPMRIKVVNRPSKEDPNHNYLGLKYIKEEK